MFKKELMEILKGNRVVDLRVCLIAVAILCGFNGLVNNFWHKKYLQLNDDWYKLAHEINKSWAADCLSGRFFNKGESPADVFIKEFFEELERRRDNER